MQILSSTKVEIKVEEKRSYVLSQEEMTALMKMVGDTSHTERVGRFGMTDKESRIAEELYMRCE